MRVEKMFELDILSLRTPGAEPLGLSPSFEHV
jgi:hypothetical protein